MSLLRAATAALLCALPAAAAARPASVGFYAEGGLGATGFLGAMRAWSRVGPSLSARLGYDLFSWFSIGAYFAASTHEATVPPPPEGEYYQLYTGGGEGRLGFRVGPVAAFATGGAGLALISSNVLDKVDVVTPDQRFSIAFLAGAGSEYQLQNRHYALGLDGVWTLLPEFSATQTITVRAYLRYTY